MTIFEEKKLLRTKMRHFLKEKYSDQTTKMQESLRACKKIQMCPAFISSQIVFFYIPYGFELDVFPLLEQTIKTKTVCVPRVIIGTSNMDFYYLDKAKELNEQLESGSFGIFEPKTTLPRVELNDSLKDKKLFMVVPALAFTKDGQRLGKGMGFYDRYLPRLKATGAQLFSAGLGYKEQLIKELPAEPTDFVLDAVITP